MTERNEPPTPTVRHRTFVPGGGGQPTMAMPRVDLLSTGASDQGGDSPALPDIVWSAVGAVPFDPSSAEAAAAQFAPEVTRNDVKRVVTPVNPIGPGEILTNAQTSQVARVRPWLKWALVLGSLTIASVSIVVGSRGCEADDSENVGTTETGGDSSGASNGSDSESETGALADLAQETRDETEGDPKINSIDSIKTFNLEDLQKGFASIQDLLNAEELNVDQLNIEIAALNRAFKALGVHCEEEILTKDDCVFSPKSNAENDWLQHEDLEALRVMLWQHKSMVKVRNKKYPKEDKETYDRFVRITKKLRFGLAAIRKYFAEK